jgi:competence protein ComEC
VDGGGFWNPEALDIGQSVLLPYFSRMGVTRLKRVFLTHAHADHMNGLFSMLRYIPVEAVYVTRRPLAEPGFQHLCMVWLPDLRSVRGGDVFRQGGVTLTVLAPDDSKNELRVANDDSLVMLVEYEGRRALLTGDAERPTEEGMTRLPLPRVDVLKVPHHGSRTSSTEQLLAAVRPGIAIVSVGRNNWFGHPHPEVVDRYRAHHVMLYRTDRAGTVRVTIAHSDVSIQTYVR